MQSNRQHSALGLALTLIVGLFLLAGPGAAPAAAQRTVSIKPPSATAYVGDAFTLTVNVDDATGVAGFQFDLSYDGALMAFASPPRPGSLLNGLGWVVLANQVNPNLLRVLGYSPSATPLAGGSGPLVALDFNAAALGTTPVILLSVLLGDTVGNPIAAVGVEGTVTVTCPAPEAAFSGDPTSGCAPLEVCFADASTGTPTSWSWSFGDGGTSAEQNPCHTYTAPGSYTVSLTAANACSSDVETKSGYVQAGGLPTAAFSASLTSGCLPLEVCFTDQSSGYPASWSWDFGDGATSTQQNPCHTYAAPGSYTVSLTVSNGCGEDTQVNPDYIQVGGSPTAAFSASLTSGLAPLEVCFTNASTGSPTSWSWDFGDGESSTEPDPCHTYYSPGRYTVSLTVGNTCG
jgi:PKD repeat protein